MSAFDHTFRSSIPGLSLTHKLGDLPHEKPPKYTDANSACDYIWKQLHNKNTLKQLWSLLEQGATVWAITRAVLYKAALEGIIQLNLAVVIYPVVSKMVATLGNAKGIKDMKYTPKFKDSIKDSDINKSINDKLGRHNHPIPPSALSSMNVPKSEDLTKDATDFLGSEPPKTAGLLNNIKGTE